MSLVDFSDLDTNENCECTNDGSQPDRLRHQRWVRRHADEFRRLYINSPEAREQALHLNTKSNSRKGI